MAALTGQIVNGYLIQEELGRGGMGVVFKAQQLSIDRAVAIKFLNAQRAQDEKAIARFLREARASGKLAHPNVVAVYDAGQAEGLHYIVMEYVDGPSAFKLLREKGAFSESETLRIAGHIAEALRFAHSKGVLHRDVKPDNFLIDSRGHVKLADLGLARFISGPGSTELTQDGAMLGTPQYMSPEQCKASGVDARSDLYSLGASMYMMATGKPPFEGPGPGAVIARVLSDAPAPLRSINAKLSPQFCELVERLMAKEPARRFGSAEQVIDAVRRASSVELTQRRKEAKMDSGKPHRGLRLRPMLFGAGCALTLLIVLGSANRKRHQPPPSTTTETSTNANADETATVPTTTTTTKMATTATTATNWTTTTDTKANADPREAQAQQLYSEAQQASRDHDRDTMMKKLNTLSMIYADTKFVLAHLKEIQELPAK